MSDDPAVEAAQRAWAVHYDRDSFRMSAEGNGFASRMTDAAREALALIREWIEREQHRIDADSRYASEINDGAMLARLDDQKWMLRELSRLVYRKDELT